MFVAVEGPLKLYEISIMIILINDFSKFHSFTVGPGQMEEVNP